MTNRVRSPDLDNDVIAPRRGRNDSSTDAHGGRCGALAEFQDTNNSNSYRPYKASGVAQYDWQVLLDSVHVISAALRPHRA